MTHDENRISDLIDGGLHEKSAIDKAKYELHMRQKAAIEEAAIKAWEADAVHNPNPNNPHAYVYGFKQGAKELIEHPERYELIAQDKALQALQPLKERVKEKRVQLARVNQRLSILLGVLKEVDEYLSDNAKNYVGSGSKLHQKIQEVLK